MQMPRRDLLRWQFDLTWSLFEFHLEQLSTDDFTWEPAEVCWTVRRSADGVWRPDWAETEPDPIPVPTVGWISWHIGWWWGTALDHLQGRPPRDREAVTWPGAGPAAIAWLRELRAEWLAVLDRLEEGDLDAVAPFPWTDDEQSVAQLVAWLNFELMKNVSEIGQLRIIRAATPR